MYDSAEANQGYWENALIESWISWRSSLHWGHSLGITTFFMPILTNTDSLRSNASEVFEIYPVTFCSVTGSLLCSPTCANRRVRWSCSNLLVVSNTSSDPPPLPPTLQRDVYNSTKLLTRWFSLTCSASFLHCLGCRCKSKSIIFEDNTSAKFILSFLPFFL